MYVFIISRTINPRLTKYLKTLNSIASSLISIIKILKYTQTHTHTQQIEKYTNMFISTYSSCSLKN